MGISTPIMGKAARAGRRAVSMADLATRLGDLARPHMETVLRDEVNGPGADAWRAEAESALRGILADAPQRELSEEVAGQVHAALGLALEGPLPPEDEEVTARAAQAGDVLASAWLQLLALMLGDRQVLCLDDCLLPLESERDEELTEAFESMVGQLPIGPNATRGVLHQLAADVAQGGGIVELPLGVAIEKRLKPHATFVARRA